MSRQNRRQFIEESMLATAAAVAASSPTALFGKESESSRSPNEKLGVAVVGLRGRGGSHIGAFAGRKDTEILYLSDVDREIGGRRVQEVTKRQARAPRFEEDLRKVLEDPRVDIVTVATPNHQHALHAIWAMQAGKDVYVERPVSHNVHEGRRMVDAARKYRRVCQAGFQCRSNPGMAAAMEFANSGALGDIRVARGICCKRTRPMGPPGEYPVPAHVNYDLWLGPAPRAPLGRQQLHHDWQWLWAYGNGDLGGASVPQIDLARWGLGARRLSDSVISCGGRFGVADARETATTQIVIHNFGARSLVCELRQLAAADVHGVRAGLILEGTDGYLVATRYDRGVAFDAAGKKIREFTGGGDHFANFLSAVRSRNARDLKADIEEGHLSSALCHLGNISYRLGEPAELDEVARRLGEFPTAEDVAALLARTREHLAANGVDLRRENLRLGLPLFLDPVAEVFVGHEEANRMLTREYREPFVVPSPAQV